MMFPIVPGNRRRPRSPQAQAIAIVAALTGAGVAIYSNSLAHARGAHTRGAASPADPMVMVAVAAALVAIPVAIFLMVKLTRNGGDCASPDDMNANDRSTSPDDESQDRRPLALVLALFAVAVAIAIGLFAWAQPVRAQGTADRGALFIRMGADTVVTDRFARSGDTLRGRSQVRGQPPVEYLALLGPQNAVRSLSYDIYAPGAKEGDKPATHLLITMKGDTALAETPSGVQRVPTKAGAIPMVNNMLALTELFTRRAKAAGGTLEMPWLAVSGGTTIMVSAKAIGTDSLSVTIAGQEQRFRVDAAGRILGGIIPGRNMEYLRGGPETAGTLRSGAMAAPAPPPDYSAPAGAPYTAEEVKVAGPGGITLGGTLTKPKNARGPLPAIVTITGSGQQDRDEYVPIAGGVRLFRALADTVSRRGIAVLRLDDRGLGASTGDFHLATSADFADDIRAGVAYLRARPDIDPARIGLVGHSEGGMIGPMIAATDPKIRALVTMAGPRDQGHRDQHVPEPVARGPHAHAHAGQARLHHARRAGEAREPDGAVDEVLPGLRSGAGAAPGEGAGARDPGRHRPPDHGRPGREDRGVRARGRKQGRHREDVPGHEPPVRAGFIGRSGTIRSSQVEQGAAGGAGRRGRLAGGEAGRGPLSARLRHFLPTNEMSKLTSTSFCTGFPGGSYPTL
jgi:dienelactone hydrolase